MRRSPEELHLAFEVAVRDEPYEQLDEYRLARTVLATNREHLARG